MKRTTVYNADPTLRSLPLSVEEAEILHGDPGMVGKRDIEHLLARVVATAAQVREQRRHYDDEMRRRTEAMPRSLSPQTLSPEQAAKFLSQEQLARLFDKFSQERLAALQAIQDKAAAEYEHLEQLVDQVITRVLHAVNVDGVDAASAEQLRKLVDDIQALRGLAAQRSMP